MFLDQENGMNGMNCRWHLTPPQRCLQRNDQKGISVQQLCRWPFCASTIMSGAEGCHPEGAGHSQPPAAPPPRLWGRIVRGGRRKCVRTCRWWAEERGWESGGLVTGPSRQVWRGAALGFQPPLIYCKSLNSKNHFVSLTYYGFYMILHYTTGSPELF